MKDIALKTFESTSINITEDDKRYLGAVIGSIEYCENYLTQKVNTWLDELNTLCDIARIEAQAAYIPLLVGINISLHTLCEPFQIYLINWRKLMT